MFFGLHCKQIVTILTELRFGLVEDESILEATVEGERINVYLLLLHYAQNLIRSGSIQVELYVSILVQGDDLE